MNNRYIGIMSGTSLDGADAVLVEFDDEPDRRTPAQPRVLASASAPFDETLRDALIALQRSGTDELHRAALAANRLADLYAQLVARLCDESGIAATDIVAIGVHGQTVRHRPELGFTIQLNAPARLAEASGITVVADFRSRDVAAGGQGAPLAPAFHAAVFRIEDQHRVVLNLGGMANVTDLPADPAMPVRGWDCGPGNVLLDGWIARHHGVLFDADGAWSASGKVINALLIRLLDEAWLALPPPKSTGRDLFDAGWLSQRLEGFENAAPQDVQATLAEFTAATVVNSTLRHAGTPDHVIVCGGGARNTDLLARLANRFGDAGANSNADTESRTHVLSCASEEAGAIAPEHVEALAFAWLAKRCVAGLAGNLPEVTGARGPRILGAIYPR